MRSFCDMIKDAPVEVVLSPLLSLGAGDVLRTALTSKAVQRIICSALQCSPVTTTGDTEAADAALLDALARRAGLQPCQLAASADSGSLPLPLGGNAGMAQLHGLGLPLRAWSAYCSAMDGVAVPDTLHFESPQEVLFLVDARRRLTAIAGPNAATSSSAAVDHDGGPPQLRSLGVSAHSGPQVKPSCTTSEVCVVADFTFEDPPRSEADSESSSLLGGGVATSGWQWVDVPHVPPLRLGVQLQADLARCRRPEIRCAVVGPAVAWVFVQAVAASPGFPRFELGLVASSFDAYGLEAEDGEAEAQAEVEAAGPPPSDPGPGWLFPREECFWRSVRPPAERSSQGDGDEGSDDEESSDEESSEEEEDGTAWQDRSSAAKIRMMLRLYAADRAMR